MDNKTKNVVIGVLLVITIASLFYASSESSTGQAVKKLTRGVLEVKPAVRNTDVEVFVNGEFAMLVETDKRPYYQIEEGTYTVLVRVVEGGKETKPDYVEKVTIVAGETTEIYPWLP